MKLPLAVVHVAIGEIETNYKARPRLRIAALLSLVLASRPETGYDSPQTPSQTPSCSCFDTASRVFSELYTPDDTLFWLSGLCGLSCGECLPGIMSCSVAVSRGVHVN